MTEQIKSSSQLSIKEYEPVKKHVGPIYKYPAILLRHLHRKTNVSRSSRNKLKFIIEAITVCELA